MRFAPAFFALMLALGLTLQGCGIRGPLYLPDPAKAKPEPPRTKQDQEQK